METLMKTEKQEGPAAEIRRAIEAGEHGVLLVGPPGFGKTALARRVLDMLPDVVVIDRVRNYQFRAYATAGLTTYDKPLPPERPFRAPHHTVSDAGLSGVVGQSFTGEVALAHGGVLMLDELVEFRRPAIERLAERLRLADIAGRPFLVATANPCPCGAAGFWSLTCKCSSEAVSSYESRLNQYAKLLKIRTRIMLGERV